MKLLGKDLTRFNIILRDQTRNVLTLNGVDWMLTFDVRKYIDHEVEDVMNMLSQQSIEKDQQNNAYKRRRML